MNHWEALYTQGKHHSVWPFTDLVSLCCRHCPPAGKRVLELGCGMGANVPFFADSYYVGVDVSDYAITTLRGKFPHHYFRLMDFTENFPDQTFDIIVDRAAVTHCYFGDIKIVIDACRDHLMTGGYYVGVDWFAGDHWGALCPDVAFPGCGQVHFTDERELSELFRGWEIVHLEHKQVTVKNKHACTINFVMRLRNVCPECDGSGLITHSHDPSPRGVGLRYGTMEDYVDCKNCNGEGWI